MTTKPSKPIWKRGLSLLLLVLVGYGVVWFVMNAPTANASEPVVQEPVAQEVVMPEISEAVEVLGDEVEATVEEVKESTLGFFDRIGLAFNADAASELTEGFAKLQAEQEELATTQESLAEQQAELTAQQLNLEHKADTYQRKVIALAGCVDAAIATETVEKASSPE